ncbi:MAG: hypothetical protein QXP42_06120, partial [Candidatus Micrarchaeia archaeon]
MHNSKTKIRFLFLHPIFIILVLPHLSYADIVSCGQTITADTVMENDLQCDSTGLIIGADNIVLDCAGHFINYSKISVGNGIQAVDRFNITIKNCLIYQHNDLSFSHLNATFLSNTNSSTITNLIITITQSFFENHVVGISLQNSSENNISNITISA